MLTEIEGAVSGVHASDFVERKRSWAFREADTGTVSGVHAPDFVERRSRYLFLRFMLQTSLSAVVQEPGRKPGGAVSGVHTPDLVVRIYYWH